MATDDQNVTQQVEEKIEEVAKVAEKAFNNAQKLEELDPFEIHLSFYELQDAKKSWPSFGKPSKKYWEIWVVKLKGQAKDDLDVDQLQAATIDSMKTIINHVNEHYMHLPKLVKAEEKESLSYDITTPQTMMSKWPKLLGKFVENVPSGGGIM
jgi:hypothetical protein